MSLGWRETYRTHAQCGAQSTGGLPYTATLGKTRQLTCISIYTPNSTGCCGRTQLHWLLHWLQHGQRPPPQAPLRRWCWPCCSWPLLRAQRGTLFSSRLRLWSKEICAWVFRVVLCGRGMKVDDTPCAYFCVVVKMIFLAPVCVCFVVEEFK